MQHDLRSLPSVNRMALLDRWLRHAASLPGAPTVEDFVAFGRLSTLERLRPMLAAAAPTQAGPLRLALRKLRAQKRSGRRAATGRQRGPALTCSVPAHALPAIWQAQLAAMASHRRRLDQGFLVDEDRRPPSIKQIAGIAYTLRALAYACRERSLPVGLTPQTIAAWLDAAEARGCRPSGLAAQIGQLRTFIAWSEPKSDLRKPLRRLARRKTSLARMQRKRKEQWLIDNSDVNLADVWAEAEALLAVSADLPLASRARHKAVIEALALALAVVVPLRIGDLHCLVVGRDIERTAVGWRLAVTTEKTGAGYKRPELWPELTPFLDALLAVDAPGGDVWAGYDLHRGKPLFSFDGGATCVHRDWISDAWQDHIGTGAHIVRTLWHELVGDRGDDRVWVALALCGQRDRRTARAYQVTQARKNAVARGHSLLAARRRRPA